MARLLVPAGTFCQANCGETFLPGQGQIKVGARGEQARFWSSPPKRTGMRAPSLIELEVRVIHGAAQASGAVNRAAVRPKASVFMAFPIWAGSLAATSRAWKGAQAASMRRPTCTRHGRHVRHQRLPARYSGPA